MNSFMNELERETNISTTTNGAKAYKSTLNKVYDLFAMGGAYRNRSEEDCILLFKNAFLENEFLALKCLFYLRDCRGGQGERRFFRTCFKWLASEYPHKAKSLLTLIPEFGRWDDLIYTTIDTPLQPNMLEIIKQQTLLDIDSKTPSLLGKWLPSENASSIKTKTTAKLIRKYFQISSKEYRLALSSLRKKINVLEKLMSANEWDKIEFEKIPSKAGLIYRNAFARRDIIAKKYEAFIKDKSTRVNAGTLFPYDVVRQARSCDGRAETDRAAIDKYWNNLPDYLNGADMSMMCVVDTSGSMTWGWNEPYPIDVAISLGIYTAERMTGPFANHYISFASKPQLIKIEGTDFVDKVNRVYRTNLVDNTNLTAVFDLIKSIAKKDSVKPEDVPKNLVIISDMQIDAGCGYWNKSAETEMEMIRRKWENDLPNIPFPKLIYWNVNAANEANFLDDGPNITYVSGCSPTIFQSVLTGKSGWGLCLDVLLSQRYVKVLA